MRLRLASRRSDLARWQAVQVARRLGALPEKPEVAFEFKSSLGDQNLDLPLAQMGSKGVFTEDFHDDLLRGRCDLVVHSWKDLPTEPREGTRIALTLPRADVRDVLMIPRAAWAQAQQRNHLTILTSSPRRVYNLGAALPTLLPGCARNSSSPPCAGTCPRVCARCTRPARRWFWPRPAWIVCSPPRPKISLEGDVSVRALIADCLFMILPVSLNPPAPAQGALAVEVARDNAALLGLCERLTDQLTFDSVTAERDVLRGYGGGCHQKIGVAVLPRPFGTVHALRGLTEAGETLHAWRVDCSIIR